jgi:hypothetical protein
LQNPDTEALLRKATANTAFNPYEAHLKSAVHYVKILHAPFPNTWNSVMIALRSANHIETTVGVSESYFALLAALDDTLTHHHIESQKDSDGNWTEKLFRSYNGNIEQSDGGRDSQRRARLHWSNFHPDARYAHPLKWEDSFLSLAVQFGLERYLQEQFGQGSKVLKSKRGRPLLHYALDPAMYVQYDLITRSVVQLLLKHGADPNEKFEETSSWERGLYWQYNHFAVQKGHSIGGETEGRALAEIRLEIFKYLLKERADADVYLKVDRIDGKSRKIDTKAALTDSFKSWTSQSSFASLIDALEAAKKDHKGTWGKVKHKVFNVH